MKINVNPFTINWLILYLISWVSSISLCLVIELKIDCFQSRISPEKALSYLSHYGYFSPISTKNLSLFDSFSESLRNFQNFFGLRQSGLLDSGTQEFMKKPRKVIIFNISFTSSRNNIIVSERPLDFPMNYWIRLRHFNVNLTGSCPNVKHQIENWKLKVQSSGVESETVRMLTRTKTQSRSVWRTMIVICKHHRTDLFASTNSSPILYF